MMNEKLDELRGWINRRLLSSNAEPSAFYDAELELCDDKIAKRCKEILQQGGYVLTPDEQAALKLTGELATALAHVIKQGDDDGAGINDWNEVAMKIHDIQHMVMSQAAARIFPDEYRLLGSRLKRVLATPE